jgi:hypothetical protein
MSQPDKKREKWELGHICIGSHDIWTPHTAGDDTRTYALYPEASKAANFVDFSTGTFVNGLVFSGEDFGGAAGATGADSTIGLVGIGGGVVGEIPDMGTCVAPMSRFTCISKSPIYQRATYNQLSNKIMQWIYICSCNNQGYGNSPSVSAQQLLSRHRPLVTVPDNLKTVSDSVALQNIRKQCKTWR